MKFAKLQQMALWAIVIVLPWGTPEICKFLYLAPENCDFVVYYNFCFLNNFLFKSQNKVPLVLGWPLRSVVYDFIFNSILPLLINFGILSPNRVISANWGFRHFLMVLRYYFLRFYMFCSRQRQIKLLLIKYRLFVKFFL